MYTEYAVLCIFMLFTNVIMSDYTDFDGTKSK